MLSGALYACESHLSVAFCISICIGVLRYSYDNYELNALMIESLLSN